MFWGVTLESGKRYSQKVAESYHLSMATLETLPVDLKPQNKEVAVMIEHGEAEYQLCVLEYGRIMQVSLDLIFDYGEVVTYFLNGEGTVHLTGYALADGEDSGSHKKSGVAALNAADDDEDDEEEDEDWTPSKLEENSDESEESDEDDEIDDESETEKASMEKSETNEDEDSDDTKRKRKKLGILKHKKTKKRKISDSSPAQNGTTKSSKVKSENQRRTINKFGSEISNNSMSENEDFQDTAEEEEEEEENDSMEYSSEEEKEEISSAGRTPMPSKRVSSKSSLGESPVLPAQQKGKVKPSDISSSNKGTIPVTPPNARKLAGNVQVEDLRMGSGPPAKNGKFVFLHYVGKLQSGKVFEICEAPKKPFAFRLGKGEVIRGLEIGVQGMKAGGKRKITIPPNMGYGKESNDVIPSNSTLCFTVELKSVK